MNKNDYNRYYTYYNYHYNNQVNLIMLIKFLNGEIIDIKDIKNIKGRFDKNKIIKRIFDYTSNSHTYNTFLPEQITYSIENIDSDIEQEDISNILLYVYIKDLESIDPEIVLSMINVYDESHEVREKKLSEYIQFLADRRKIELSTSSKYCELYLKSRERDEDENGSSKISSLWSRHITDMEFFPLDDDKYLCKNVPINIGENIYKITTIYFKDDLD